MWRGLVLGSLVVGGLGAAMQPAAADDQADELQYVSQVTVLMQLMGDSLTDFGEKMPAFQANFADKEAMADVSSETGVWEAVYDIALTLDAPDGFEIAHYELLNTFRPYAEAAPLAREGMANLDTGALKEATALIDEGVSHVPIATQALEEAAARD